MTKPVLSYFSVRGLAEPIRLLLADAKVEYENRELGIAGPGIPLPPAVTALKQSGVLDYGAVPLWEEEGFSLVQSGSIARHLARKYGYSGDNENEASKADSVMEGVKDFFSNLRKPWTVPAEQRAKVWTEVLDSEEVRKWLGFFENILKKNGTGFFVGTKISVADIYVFVGLEELVYSDFSFLPFPLLHSFFNSISSRPNLATYIASPSRHPPMAANFIKK